MERFAFLRTWWFAATVLLFGCFFFPWLLFSSAFQTGSTLTVEETIGSSPLLMNSALRDFQKYLATAEGQAVFDTWGLVYPPSEKVSVSAFDRRERVALELNDGIGYLRADRASLAVRSLRRYYASYMAGVRPGNGEVDELPERELDRLLYGLVRYNRAVALLALAETNSRGHNRAYGMLREALYDLRRAVGAFEHMGAVKEDSFQYWGSGRQAWEGVRLADIHGDLPMHQVYTNLATAYLRIGGEDGYPWQTTSYLARERRKYAYGDDAQLAPIVHNLIDICLEQDNAVPLAMFRLVQALHNLEAARRGADNDRRGMAVFNYTIGLLLEHLARFPESGIARNDAIEFFRSAARLSKPDSVTLHLANKEQVLNLVMAGRHDEAALILGELDIGETELAIRGPMREQGLLFIDFAQFRHFADGNWTLAISHFERRLVELENPAARTAHQRVVGLLGQAFFRDLAHRARQRPAHQIGGLIASLQQDERLMRIEPLAAAYRDELRGAFLLNPSVQTNLWLRADPGRVLWLRLSSLVLLGLFGLYLWWVYRSHQRLARQIILSRY